jgi:hypothetical protein
MFFSNDILSLKSNAGLGVVWLAGTLGHKSSARRLHRRDYISVDVANACHYLQEPPEAMSLRLSAKLMVGVVRVYGWQCQFCFGDATALYGRLEQSVLDGIINKAGGHRQAGNAEAELDLPVQKAKHDAITITGNNTNELSSGNVWSELDKLKTIVNMTPDVERGRQQTGSGHVDEQGNVVLGTNRSDSTNTIPGRISSTPLKFGADENGLLKELFGDLSNMNDLETPNSEDALLSGIFHHDAAGSLSSLLDVPEQIQIKQVSEKSKRKNTFMMDEAATMLSREEMFEEKLINLCDDFVCRNNTVKTVEIAELLKGQTVDLGVTHQAWSSLGVNQNIVIPVTSKKRRRSSSSSAKESASVFPEDGTVEGMSSPAQPLDMVDFEQDILMPWSEPVSEGTTTPLKGDARSSASRDSLGFLRFLENCVSPKASTEDKGLYFDDVFVVGRVSRRVVARAFHNVLQAAGEARVGVEQECPFGKIRIVKV